MRLHVRRIDFRRGAVVVDAHPDHTDGLLDRFDRFLEACQRYGLRDVRVGVHPGMTDLQRVVLGTVARRHGAHVGPVLAEATQPAAECLVGGDAAWPCAVGAHLRLRDRGHAVERATAAAVLVALAYDADESSRADLQMCVHELVVNSVEHGVFRGPFDVRIDIRADGEGFAVTYRDNAEPFATHPRPAVDIAQRVAHGARRGLGLHILATLPASIRYRRLGAWNVTEFRVQRRGRPADSREGRPTMAEITIEIVPCEVPDTRVVRPRGSIDSSTTRMLEEQIDEIVDGGARYVVVDLEAVDFVSSAGIGLFLGTAARLRREGGDLAFMNMPRHVREVFEIINLTPYFRVVDSPADVAASSPTE